MLIRKSLKYKNYLNYLNMFFLSRNFKKALNDVILSRRAIQNMNTLYPDATPEELQMSDNICIICREDMVNNSKKLPCGHIFHTICLRSWFQRQQTCPTCRLNILRTPVQASSPVARAANVRPNGAVPNNENNQPNQMAAAADPNIVAGQAGGLPQMMPQMFPPGGIPQMPLFPQMPMMAPFLIPPPPIPPGLDTLTEEELRLLEGTERKNVEERIKFLRNVQMMLDASVTLMNQYSAISAQFPIPIPPPPAVVEPVPEALSVQLKPEPPEEKPQIKEENLTEKITIRDVIEETEEQQMASSSSQEEPNPFLRGGFFDDEAAELRRRRLQKFTATEALQDPPSNN